MITYVLSLILQILSLITNNITVSFGYVSSTIWPLLSLVFCSFMLPPFIFPLLLHVLTSSYLQFAIPKTDMWLVLTKVIPDGWHTWQTIFQMLDWLPQITCPVLVNQIPEHECI